MYGESIIAVHVRDFLLPKIPFGRPRGDGRRSRARRLRCGHEEMYDIDAIRGLDGFWVGWEERNLNLRPTVYPTRKRLFSVNYGGWYTSKY
jgi:hypothetical protein